MWNDNWVTILAGANHVAPTHHDRLCIMATSACQTWCASHPHPSMQDISATSKDSPYVRSFSPIAVRPSPDGRYRAGQPHREAPLTRDRAGPGRTPTPLMAEYYAQRADAGLIIAEATQISPEGQGYLDTPGIYSSAQVKGWKAVTDAVHARGGKMVLQCGTSAASPIPAAAGRQGTGRSVSDPRQGQDLHRQRLRASFGAARTGCWRNAAHRRGIPLCRRAGDGCRV